MPAQVSEEDQKLKKEKKFALEKLAIEKANAEYRIDQLQKEVVSRRMFYPEELNKMLIEEKSSLMQRALDNDLVVEKKSVKKINVDEYRAKNRQIEEMKQDIADYEEKSRRIMEEIQELSML
ncbi:unnamed protein product [Caenorhabditis auriculariae]|uniref:Uncharacterized protein n=1 Tax=Caenorhabditis auriculariae TaxID=2777116 RepID=A0A8S1GRD5_9PELO|nr:unnamed protein product [Caenorhabditis auriculariae]